MIVYIYINGSKIACFAAPNELFAEIRKHHPGFGYRVELDENMNKFAAIWCGKNRISFAQSVAKSEHFT